MVVYREKPQGIYKHHLELLSEKTDDKLAYEKLFNVSH